MSNFNPADWAIGVLRPSNRYVGDLGIQTLVPTPVDEAAMQLWRLGRSMMLLDAVEQELEDRRTKRLLLEAEASGRAVRLDAENVEVERLADFIEKSPDCLVTTDDETGEFVLICPDAETASLARLSL